MIKCVVLDQIMTRRVPGKPYSEYTIRHEFKWIPVPEKRRDAK